MFAWGRAVRRRRAKQAAWNDRGTADGTEEKGSEQGMEWSAAVVSAMGGVQLEGEDFQEAAKRPRRPEINSGPGARQRRVRSQEINSAGCAAGVGAEK